MRADTLPADTLPADTLPADTLPADTLPADTLSPDSAGPPATALAAFPLQREQLDAQIWDSAPDGQGGVFIVGSLTGSLQLGSVSLCASDQDILMARLDAQGNVLWAKTFGGLGDDLASRVAVGANGEITVTGTLADTADFGGGVVKTQLPEEIFLARFDANGHHRWSLSFGTKGMDYPSEVAVDGSGNVVLYGHLDFFSTKRTSFLARYSASGVLQWKRTVTGTSRIGYVAASAGGDLFLGGSLSGSTFDLGAGPITTPPDSRSFVTRLSSAGVPTWTTFFKGPGSLYLDAAALKTNASSLLSLYSTVPVDLGSGPISGARLLQVDGNGALVWDKALPVRARRIGVGAQGAITCAGHFSGNNINLGGGPLPNAGHDDLFVARLDSSGAHLWSKSYGTTASENLATLAVSAAGDVTLTGRPPFINGGAKRRYSFLIKRFDNAGASGWVQHHGNTKAMKGIQVAADLSGVAVMASYSSTITFAGQTFEPSPSGSRLVVHYDPQGKPLWARKAVFRTISASPQRDGVALVSDEEQPSPGWGRAARIEVIDSSGATLWKRDINWAIGSAAAMDSTGAVVLVGTAYGRADFGQGPLGDPNDRFFFITRVAKGGALMWSRSFPAQYTSDVKLSVNRAGAIGLLVRISKGSIDFGGGLVDCTDWCWTRYDPSGLHLSSRTTHSKNARDIAVDEQGGTILTGVFSKTINLGGQDLVPKGAADAYIVRYSSTGTHSWSTSFGGSAAVQASHISVDRYGAISVLGEFSKGSMTIGADLLENLAPQTELFVAHLDAQGAPLWGRTFGSRGTSEDALDLTLGPGGVIVPLVALDGGFMVDSTPVCGFGAAIARFAP